MVMDKISALMDGELSEQEARINLLRLKQHREHSETWALFHLIGDAMRDGPLLRHDFTARVCSRLDREPTIVTPRFTYKRMISYTLSAAASLAAVAVVLTLVIATDHPFHSDQQQVAQEVASPSPQPKLIGQDKVNEYLMAHQEFSPSTTLQGVAPYVRTVSDSSADR
jgi:sigma-E factor negative regulatory protein RseA